MTPEEYYSELDQKHKELRDFEAKKDQVKIPSMDELRELEADDVRVGRVFFYVDDELKVKAMRISAVYCQGDEWKGFEADDGCRYGLACGFMVRKS